MGRSVQRIIKRLLDIAFSLIGLVLLLPLLALFALAIKVGSPGPILYKGVRSGLGGRPFKIMKFRSMVVDAESKGGGTTALGDSRITRIGKVLRRWKFDELPQLWNVLIGEMSFVGPRPELPYYTDQYTEHQKKILEVPPGITDLSSLEFASLDEIVGNDNADDAYEKLVLNKKNDLRLYYAEHWSLALDASIFMKTFFVIFQKVGRDAGKIFRRGNHGVS